MAVFSVTVHPLLVTTESASVRAGSGTAVAVQGLAAALATQGIHLAVLRLPEHRLGHTVGRARQRWHPPTLRALHDVVLGINGDGLEAARRAGLPFVALPKALYAAVVPHEPIPTRWLITRHAAWELEACRAADAVVAPSRAAAAALAAAGVESSRLHVIGEPLDSPAGAAASGVHPAPGLVLVVAHLYARKRVGDVLEAWPAITAAVPEATLHVAGDGPELKVLRRRACRLHGVHIHGHLDGAALRRLHARAAVAVSASAHETFGYAVLEALASGLPVVVADAPAVVELVANSVHRAVPVGDAVALAGAVIACLDPAVRARAARRNPALARRFAPEVIGAAYARLLSDVAGLPPRPRE
ncbi:MAG: glycosyltransferase [Candidatus Dormibacteria bacterium]